MKRFLAPLALACAAVVLASTFGGTTTASAHERRAVGEKYMMVVGFLNEPAFVGLENGLDLRIFTGPDGADLAELPTAERVGIEGLEETLEAEVIVGERTMALEIEPRFRDPGAYNGHFFPTATGDYTFHISGTVEGTAIDETFTSSPETFSSVAGTTELQFPVKVPSNEELAAEIESVKASGSGSGSGSTATATEDDDDNSDMAMILGIVGIVVGAVGIGIGGLALSRSRS
jgi:hypothetical protein